MFTSVYVVFHCMDGIDCEGEIPCCGTNKGPLILCFLFAEVADIMCNLSFIEDAVRDSISYWPKANS